MATLGHEGILEQSLPMLCFNILVNGERVTTAGIDSFGNVSANVQWPRSEAGAMHGQPAIDLFVSGQDGRQQL